MKTTAPLLLGLLLGIIFLVTPLTPRAGAGSKASPGPSPAKDQAVRQAPSAERVAPAATPAPTPPDFSNVTDILGGRRTLLQVDDVMISYQNRNDTVWQTSAFTSGGGIASDNASAECGYGGPSGFASGIGRMFNQPNDVEFTVMGNGYLVTVINPNNQNSCGDLYQYPNPFGTSPSDDSPNQFPSGDFNGDGFADFAVSFNGQPYPLMAKDVNNLNAGIYTGSPGDAPDPNASVIALAAGDFDGNGDDEVARFSMNSGTDSVNVVIYDLQSAGGGNWRFVNVGQTRISLPKAANKLRAAAGVFSGATSPDTGIFQHQLLIAYDQPGGSVDLATIQATVQSTNPPSFELSVADQITGGSSVNLVDLQSARLDFFAPTEQAVLATDLLIGGISTNILSVVTFDPALKITIGGTSEYVDLKNPFGLQIGIAVGNFDQPTGPNTPALALQIASLVVNNKGEVYVYVYDVDPANNFALTLKSRPDEPVMKLIEADGAVPRIVTGDLQGRSVLLGEPTKVTTGHVQPRLVLGMPPMHVDWVKAADGSAPQVLNLTAALNTFYSSYQTAVTGQAQSSSQSTTSWTHAISETVSGGYQWGGSETGSVDVKVSESAKYMHESTVAKQYNTYQSTEFDVSAATGFDDQVWYNDERHNVYVYPVIGQTACPADQPDCSDAERLPLTVMISGPDQIAQESTTGATLEWFQPVWEPGNILSYPWNLPQLQAQYPSVDLLTSASPTKFFTDNSTLTEQAKWAGGTGSTSTTSTANNASWETSVSITKTPPDVTGGASGSLSLSYNGSVALSTLKTSTTTLGASTGIGITKPNFFRDPDEYQYGIQPFIFGNNPVDGTFDTVNLGTDIQTNGILRAAFVADPTDPSAGPWWGDTYTLPDVALNHPARWSVKQAYTGDDTSSCIGVDPSAGLDSCATFNAPDPTDVWGSEFYWMKGLLITPAAAAADGPQITQAKAGDGVRLQARVYNYSLADMPAGSQVVVQFYGQPWNTTNHTPAGDSFLIENVALGPIPGFGNDGGQPNWAVAETTALDTTAHSDQHLVFWVLVVLKDGQGNPSPEMPGHGLYGVPPTVSSIAEATSWVEPYSNNLGMYKSAFYIAPQNTEPSALAAEGDLTIKRVSVAPKRALLHEKVSVSAMLRAGGQALDGVSVKFYDGDPARGGKLFDVEHLSHIRANDVHQVRVPFRPTTCGTHTLYVTTHPQAQVGTVMLRVRIKPLPVVRDLTRLTRALELPARNKRYVLDLLRDARQAFRRLDVGGALSKLAAYREKIAGLRGGAIPVAEADAILGRVDLLSSCVGLDMEMTKEELREDQAAGHE